MSRVSAVSTSSENLSAEVSQYVVMRNPDGSISVLNPIGLAPITASQIGDTGKLVCCKCSATLQYSTSGEMIPRFVHCSRCGMLNGVGVSNGTRLSQVGEQPIIVVCPVCGAQTLASAGDSSVRCAFCGDVSDISFLRGRSR